jgi:hypothetical protein
MTIKTGVNPAAQYATSGINETLILAPGAAPRWPPMISR